MLGTKALDGAAAVGQAAPMTQHIRGIQGRWHTFERDETLVRFFRRPGGDGVQLSIPSTVDRVAIHPRMQDVASRF